jgi:hypothetical protein
MSNNIIRKIVQDMNIKLSSDKRPVISNLFMGAGIFHAIYTESDYWQIPLAIITPSAYTGYHIYKYRDNIKSNLIKK